MIVSKILKFLFSATKLLTTLHISQKRKEKKNQCLTQSANISFFLGQNLTSGLLQQRCNNPQRKFACKVHKQDKKYILYMSGVCGWVFFFFFYFTEEEVKWFYRKVTGKMT